MSIANARKAVETGIRLALDLAESYDVFGTGEMGIGNTTPSSAIAAVVTGKPVRELTGRGTGLDDEQLGKKIAIIEKVLEINKPDPKNGLDILAKIGGYEIGGIAGLILGAAARRKPVVVDGFISTAGALITEYLPGTGPRKHHFPERNRVLAGLANAVVVVEAAARSGALITARLALDEGREVMAVPGSILSPVSCPAVSLTYLKRSRSR